MNTPDLLLSTLVNCYCKHRRYFYLDNYQNFKLFASWYLQEDIGTEYLPGEILPWYIRNYELIQLAKILKCTEQQLLKLIEEYYDGCK